MKTKFILSIIVIIGFIMSQLGNMTTVANQELDLQTIATVLKDENILLNEWTFHAREHLLSFKSDREVEEYVTQLQEKFPKWQWSETSDGHKWEVIAVSPASKHHQEKLQMIATLTNDKIDAYMVYEVKGQKWSKESEAFLSKHFEPRLSNIFRGNPTIFSCMKGVFSDKIDSALPNSVNKVLSRFNAKEIEALKEDTFISVSAFSPKFAESIQSEKDNMNLQIAVRSQGLGAKTTIVVGTPIITIEY
ncbi:MULTISPECIES: YwmB family TATA-box binding protein [unclassified Bacillus (in: firmicutes)]|uniref:YwmB family TATA-box binding protein n=1 Tax=unclassified Bacillus (in: firmicutes) TaxID=185979 RepID=UPI0008F19028|nr:MULTISPECIES: YwmB family TATA-box binding protein [unclassified Bacillus (in: firmicutes)]SFB04060.1 TATA-box binding [Bacillus sp. UNCCL13]SFQ88604.1 TATA-box binding [Bacillus sp. cl95]